MESVATHFPSLLKMSGQASVLIVLVLLVQWALGRRLQPRWRCALWMLVLVRLTVPWTLPSPTSLFNTVKIPTAISTPGEVAAESVINSAAPPPRADTLPSLQTAPARIHWIELIWVAGMVVLAGGAAINQIRFHRRVSRRRPLIKERVLNVLEDCREALKLEIPITVVESDAVENPALYGFLHPRLLLPPGLASSFSDQELRHVFLHELAHVKRRDILLGWVMLILQTVHWFNPLVWLAAHRLRVDRELACDAMALSHIRTDDHESYGLTILKLLERFGQSGWAPGLARILENKGQTKERIKMIATFKKTNRGLALALCVFSGLALAALTEAQDSTNAPRTSAATSESSSDEWNLQEQIKMAEAGNQWAAYRLWDAYYRGTHGIQRDPAQAQRWLNEVVKNVWVVRFEPEGEFAPKTPRDFLDPISKYARMFSGKTDIGHASFFRTTRQGDKLVGSFLSTHPDELKAGLSKVPNLKVISTERITPEEFVKYEESPQESLTQTSKLREKFNQRMALDLKNHSRDQLREAEQLYQVANEKWGTPEAKESLETMIKKYPDINRTGCAMLYLAQKSTGDQQINYLRECIEKFNDCYYGDGVQVGAYARFILAQVYKDKGKDTQSADLLEELRTKYPDAVDHSGSLLISRTYSGSE